MDITPIVDGLNDQQRQAVTADLSHHLILAGAGSGKTRVLVHRIAWLINVEHVSPHAIIAVTFTNKAARELRERIETLLRISTRGMWVGTFHGLAHRVLRAHHKDAELPENFQILDSDDQLRVVKRVTRALNLDEEHWPPRKTQWFINAKKDEGLRAANIKGQSEPYIKTMTKLYQAYENACQTSGVIDFAEILLRCHELWLKKPNVLQHYRERFKHVLVDEFQDTNAVQYAWLRLVGQGATMMAVGDDDQSIYGWRGARIENIQRFSHDFPNTTVIRLEQNYRSTATILEAANTLIANNSERLGKELWTEGSKGEPISVYCAFNEVDEAKYIVGQIQKLSNEFTRRDFAILYRSNAQSRVIEEALLQAGIPYRVFGGLRFFDRAEIKDALAYLRLVASRNDDSAFERIINNPPRGIGEKTLSLLRDIAREQSVTLWDATHFALEQKQFTSRAGTAVTAFVEMIEEMDCATKELSLSEQMAHIIHVSGLIQYFAQQKGERATMKRENIEELISATRNFTPDADDDLPLLAAFLSHAALESGEMQADEFEDCVQLMTLHMAKGLEFPVVFLAGVEEGLFPHKMSIEEPGRLAEERRLCYVGMTRAQHKLFMTHAEVRRQYGSEEYHRPSRFLREIPAEFKQEERLQVSAKPFVKTSSIQEADIGDTGLQLGQAVYHEKFGEGVIVNYEGKGARAEVQVEFAEHGSKWLMLRYANLVQQKA